MDIKKVLGQNIKKYRKRANLTQEDLAEKLDISTNHLGNIEVGKKFMSSDLLEKLSTELAISPSVLFYSPDIVSEDDTTFSKVDSILQEELGDLLKRVKERIRED